jgi:pyridoxamine 5'-phosphate oxidase
LRDGVRWGPAARRASLAYGALRRENRTPAAAADQHFKVLIVIEPNLDRVWAALMAGAQPGRTPFNVVELATSGLDDAPKVRSVILRSADAERGAVSFSTDLRSAKIKEMRRQPRVSLIGYDADAGFQIRLEGKATIDKEGRKKAAAWAACRSHSRTLFQHTLPSGTPIAAPPEAAPADDGDGERHFAVVAVSIIRIDWLDISGPVHLRAVFQRDGCDWRGGWVVP